VITSSSFVFGRQQDSNSRAAAQVEHADPSFINHPADTGQLLLSHLVVGINA
jgi:hypothetical protein